MRKQYLESEQCLKWLEEVHKVPALQFRCAIVHDESCPTQIELYARNHHQCKPWVYLPDADGKMVLHKTGEMNNPEFLHDRPLLPNIDLD